MPAKSKAQMRFMQAVAHGSAEAPGLSKEEAQEYVSHNKGSKSYKNLPERKKKARKDALEKLRNG